MAKRMIMCLRPTKSFLRKWRPPEKSSITWWCRRPRTIKPSFSAASFMKRTSGISWSGCMARRGKAFLLIFGAVLVSNCLYGFTEAELAGGLAQMQASPRPAPESKRLAETLNQAVHSYQSVRDYQAVFYKAERSEKGGLEPLEKIFLKFEKPWKIYMKWLNTDKKGLEVLYEKGKNKGKLVIHQPNLLFGLAPVIFLDQKSPWVQKGSASYNIEDAGIGAFLFDFTNAVVQASRDKKIKVNFHGKRKFKDIFVEKWEVIFPESQNKPGFFAYRVIVFFDEAHHLPVQMELLNSQNETTGIYQYKDLKINVGEDPEFKKEINRHLYKVYDRGR